MAHPNDDAYWQERNLNPHLRDIKPALLVTGGLFDCEDFYGTLATYKKRRSPEPKDGTLPDTRSLGTWRMGRR